MRCLATLRRTWFFQQLFDLAGVLQQSRLTEGMGLHVLTDRAFDVLGTGDCFAPTTTAASLADVLGLELPGLKRRVVDYQGDLPSASLARLLAGELASPIVDQVVAYRGKLRWLPQWTKL